MEQQYDSVSQDLERERQLNESMKLSGSLLGGCEGGQGLCAAVAPIAAPA